MQNINKYLLIHNDKLKEYLDKAEKELRDVYYVENFNEHSYNAFNNFDNYDVIVISYNNKEEKNNAMNIIFKVYEDKESEVVIFNGPEFVEYDEDDFYYVLSVVSGSYEDTYKRVIGVFKSRKKAKDYYHKHCEVTIEDIEKNNEEFEKLTKNEPNIEDFKLDNDEYDEDSYDKVLSEFWNNIELEYIPEDESTSCDIKKVKLIEEI